MTNQTSSKANTTESPLLRLPAELRSRIWEHAAERQIVGVYAKGPISPSNADGFHDDIDIRGTYQLPQQVGDYSLDFCIITPKGDYQTGWNRNEEAQPTITSTFARGIASAVCRQIRVETLNLQYQTQIFQIDDPADLSLYLDELSHARCCAVQHVSLSANFDPRFFVDSPRSIVIDTFPNVKRIYYGGHDEKYSPDKFGAFKEDMKLLGQSASLEIVFADPLDPDVHRAQVYKI